MYVQVKKLRNTNPETSKDQLIISNCFELHSEGSTKQLPGFEVPGIVLFKLFLPVYKKVTNVPLCCRTNFYNLVNVKSCF